MGAGLAMWARGRRPCDAGISLPELLVVVSIIGLAVAVAVPAITAAVRSARLRSAVSQFSVSLKAARMIAVTQQSPVEVTVKVAPDNYYEYVDAAGRLRRFDMPAGVRILASASPITFNPNGSLSAVTTTTFEARLRDHDVEVWECRTNVLGISKVNRL